jgi:formate/nitrite transporter FocA (FNT family)
VLARPEGWARVPLAALVSAWSLAAGLGGLVLLGAWLFTDHVFWYPNANLLQLNPLSLAITVLAAPLVVRRVPSDRAVRLALVVAALSLVGVALLAILAQRNGEILAATVPVNVAVAAALHRLRHARL